MQLILWFGVVVMSLAGQSANAETEAEYGATRAPASLARFAPQAAQALLPLTAAQREERGFLRGLASTSRLQALAGKLALSRTRHPRLRELALAMVARDESIQPALLRLLHVRGMALPMLDNAQSLLLKRLGKASGSKFDREFVEQIVLKAQQEQLAQFERMANLAVDPALHAWIARQHPLVRDQAMLGERIAAGSGQRPRQH